MKVEIYDIIMHIINLFRTCSQKKKSGKTVFKRNSKDFLVGNINQFLFKDKQTLMVYKHITERKVHAHLICILNKVP